MRLFALALLAAGCATTRHGVLRLAGAPADALVTIDDVYVGKLVRLEEFGLSLIAGEHRVTIEATGYFPEDRLVVVPADGSAKIHVTLEQLPD
jgi:hypothetical protein